MQKYFHINRSCENSPQLTAPTNPRLTTKLVFFPRDFGIGIPSNFSCFTAHFERKHLNKHNPTRP